jgi:hypothetical protein
VRLGRLDGREHLRPGRDVEPLAHPRLHVREHPVGEKLEHGVAPQQVAGVEVIGRLAPELAEPPLVELDRDDVRPLRLDDGLHLVDALGGDVGGADHRHLAGGLRRLTTHWG